MSVVPYLQLTKPRLLPLVLFSGLPALLLASERWPEPELILWTLLGTAMAAGAANAFNSYLERHPDARMKRTRARPLPAGALQPGRALTFGLVLSVGGTGLLWLGAGIVPAALATAAILVYVFVYTLWLKPRHPVAVVVGGLSGAIAPLIADAAVRGSVGLPGLILFAIIFLWQPPHFYAITLYRQSDYTSAGFPTLADRVGARSVRRRIIAWVTFLIPVSLLPLAVSRLGPLYGAAAVLLGAWLLWHAIRLNRLANDAAAQRFFRVSIVYLSGLFLVMLVDTLIWGTSL